MRDYFSFLRGMYVETCLSQPGGQGLVRLDFFHSLRGSLDLKLFGHTMKTKETNFYLFFFIPRRMVCNLQ